MTSQPEWSREKKGNDIFNMLSQWRITVVAEKELLLRQASIPDRYLVRSTENFNLGCLLSMGDDLAGVVV